MLLKGIDHLAFITNDMEKTIRFYRDLLGMELVAGIGHQGYRHYFFKFGDNQVAFFEYDIAKPMEQKFHGSPTDKPLGFDHVSFIVDSCEDRFRLKDKLEAAGFEVTGASRWRRRGLASSCCGRRPWTRWRRWISSPRARARSRASGRR